MATIASDPATTATKDRLAILDLTARLALLVDARDWDALEGLFTNPVHSDRTSLFGGATDEHSRRVRRRLALRVGRPRRDPPPDHLSVDQPRRRPGNQRAQHAGNTRARKRLRRSRVDSRRPPRLPVQTDGRRLADRRNYVHGPMDDRQPVHPDARGCRTTSLTERRMRPLGKHRRLRRTRHGLGRGSRCAASG